MAFQCKLFQYRERVNSPIMKAPVNHVDDLAWTILKMGVSQMATTALMFLWFAKPKYFLTLPWLAVAHSSLRDSDGAFGIWLELCPWEGLALAVPFHVYFMAAFMRPVLTRERRKPLLAGLAAGFLAFLGGVFVAWRYLLPVAIVRVVSQTGNEMMLMWTWTWRDYYNFATWLCLGLGLVCELPFILGILTALGFVDFRVLTKLRLYVYALILVLAFIASPTRDPVTVLIMAAPFLLTYEACTGVVWLLDRPKFLMVSALG